jgi:dTDP-4-dehydrorhamnose reductase
MNIQTHSVAADPGDAVLSGSGAKSTVLEMWAGHECTVNRVGTIFTDQSALSGHSERLSDIDLFAGLGISALRYPVLWEKIEPAGPGSGSWQQSDERLLRLRTLDVRPIVGLVHHGSGPLPFDLLSPDFAPGLAAFARRVALRYPWITMWSPVNEPLTTARFSALYGHWYPHLKDEQAFWGALLNQVDAIRLSMAAIRAVIPGAQLIQTEDIGRTYSTRPMSGQAEFDNLRRWAGYDLLCGRLTPEHPLWRWIAGFGFEERLRMIGDEPCPPDVMGINHYLTSDRFLDHRTGRYPAHVVGRNGCGPVADVEAVRVVTPVPSLLEGAVRDTWERYRLPIAITELHNGCSREEQMRWVLDGWNTAKGLRATGIDIRAVTAWSLLGSYGWDGLLTRGSGRYECGVFDVRGDAPRPTAMAPLIRDLAHGNEPRHPVLGACGWWRATRRLLYPPVRVPAAKTRLRRVAGRARQPLVITGATGTLGRALAAACELRAIEYVLTDRAQLPLTDPACIDQFLSHTKPWAVINAAGWVRVDEAETNPQPCIAVNRDGAVNLARACADRGIHFTNMSSDLVFDGVTRRPYLEGDAMRPLSVYGHSKADADRELLSWGGKILVIRTAAFFSPHDTYNFAAQLVRSLRRQQPFDAANCSVSPTYVPDLVAAVLDIVIDGERGLWHVVNEGQATWAEFGREIARSVGLNPSLVRENAPADMGWTAPRPAAAQLATSRGYLLPCLDDAISRFGSTLRASNFAL